MNIIIMGFLLAFGAFLFACMIRPLVFTWEIIKGCFAVAPLISTVTAVALLSVVGLIALVI